MTTTRIDERTVLAETPDPSVDHDLGRATKRALSDAGQITTIIDEFLRTGIDEVLVGRPTALGRACQPVRGPGLGGSDASVVAIAERLGIAQVDVPGP